MNSGHEKNHSQIEMSIKKNHQWCSIFIRNKASFKPATFIHLINTYREFTFPGSLHSDFIPLSAVYMLLWTVQMIVERYKARVYEAVSLST